MFKLFALLKYIAICLAFGMALNIFGTLTYALARTPGHELNALICAGIFVGLFRYFLTFDDSATH
ncbi:hypothetical protein D3C87_637130 [compost metagenome]